MQSPVTKEETNNNWFDSCEFFFFFETYVYYKTLSSSITSPITQHTHNISPHISPIIVLMVGILSKITRVRFCHFITKCFNHGGAILKNRGGFNWYHSNEKASSPSDASRSVLFNQYVFFCPLPLAIMQPSLGLTQLYLPALISKSVVAWEI